mgnify:CR=1 FL=1
MVDGECDGLAGGELVLDAVQLVDPRSRRVPLTAVMISPAATALGLRVRPVVDRADIDALGQIIVDAETQAAACHS